MYLGESRNLIVKLKNKMVYMYFYVFVNIDIGFWRFGLLDIYFIFGY